MLSDNEKQSLADIIERCHEQWEELNGWEQGFITDQEKRYEEYGAEIRLSPKQWEALHKIESILINGRNHR